MDIFLIAQFEAVIQKGHEPYVHHMNVFKCPGTHFRNHIGFTYECYKPKNVNIMPCGRVLTGWAVGGGVSMYIRIHVYQYIGFSKYRLLNTSTSSIRFAVEPRRSFNKTL